MKKYHKFTPEEKLELDAIIMVFSDVTHLYKLSADTLKRAMQEAERGHLYECTELRIQSLNYELRALDTKIKVLDRYQRFLEGICHREGWIKAQETRYAGTA